MSMLRKFLLQTYLNQSMTVEYEQKGITRNTCQLFLRNTFYSWIHDFKTTKVIFMLLLFVILGIIYQGMIFLTLGAFFHLLLYNTQHKLQSDITVMWKSKVIMDNIRDEHTVLTC